MRTILLLGVCRSDACDGDEMDRRCQLAAKLCHQAVDARVIACGGAQKDEREAEAAVMKRRLLELGVAEADIRLEDASRTTMENLLFALQMLNEAERRNLFIATSDYHVPRARLIARRLGLKAWACGAKTPFSLAKLRRIALEFACMLDVLLGFEDPGAKRPAWRRGVMRLFGQDKP